MPSTCEFHLNSPNAVYYSGQVVCGSIVLKTTSDKDVRNVRIRFVGEAKVSWTETERHRRSDGHHESRTVYFRANEVYIDNSTQVRGEGVLPKGTHTYTFNIPLPLSCPTSCEGKYGHIRYALWLIVERPFRFDNEFSKPLTVIRTVDLNLNPVYRIPLEAEKTSAIGCWPCSGGDINYTLKVPFGAYAPGQTLRYTILIQNQSMTDISGYSLEFNEHITFTAHTPRHKTREKDTTLATQEHSDKCLRLTNRQFEGELILPSLPPDTEDNCIIRVRHRLEFEMYVDGCHANKTISVPIFIGTVPLRESMTNDSSFTEVAPSAPLLPSDENTSDLPPSYGDFKPPSFEEAIRSHSPFQDPDANTHSNVIGFRPLYPVYPNNNEKQ
ncbi:arrestin domain-containing protein 17 [Musca domestica]|uniref:Arrestin (Or S-antigen) n=1 Tax=Musca domestica TaxID=7370 RepID=T1PHQ4_MUSDO|nr:arrestin domain-containing protein 17 [Musca domestica]